MKILLCTGNAEDKGEIKQYMLTQLSVMLKALYRKELKGAPLTLKSITIEAAAALHTHAAMEFSMVASDYDAIVILERLFDVGCPWDQLVRLNWDNLLILGDDYEYFSVLKDVNLEPLVEYSVGDKVPLLIKQQYERDVDIEK